MAERQRGSCLQPLQFAQDAFEFRNERREFLAGGRRRVAGGVAGLKELAQGLEDFVRNTAAAETLVDDGLRNRGGGEVEALAELFLEKAKERREKLGRLLHAGVGAQFLQAFADARGDFALT